jgi:hypothetical protein
MFHVPPGKKGKEIGTPINLARRSRNQMKVPQVNEIPLPVPGCPLRPKPGTGNWEPATVFSAI